MHTTLDKAVTLLLTIAPTTVPDVARRRARAILRKNGIDEVNGVLPADQNGRVKVILR